jgi:hypothetical protein
VENRIKIKILNLLGLTKIINLEIIMIKVNEKKTTQQDANSQTSGY